VSGSAGDTVRYLRLIGRLYPDNRLALMPGYLTDSARGSVEDPASSLIAEFSDGQDKPLLRYRIPLHRYCVLGEQPPVLAVRGTVPFPPATRTIRFFRDDVLIDMIAVSPEGPAVELKWKPPGTVKGTQTLTWTGSHPRKAALRYFLRYSNDDGETWQRIGRRTAGTMQEIDFDALPGGDRCRVAAVATDGVNTSTALSPACRVPVKPCQVVIFSPREGVRLSPDRPVVLHGQGFYLEEGRAEVDALHWSSSLDGELGSGRMLTLARLSPGAHRITLTAGRADRAGHSSVSVTVTEARPFPGNATGV
jgi:hypothetical protein